MDNSTGVSGFVEPTWVWQVAFLSCFGGNFAMLWHSRAILLVVNTTLTTKLKFPHWRDVEKQPKRIIPEDKTHGTRNVHLS